VTWPVLSPLARSRIRLVVMALGLIPLAIFARMAGDGKLQELVQRLGARAWRAHDEVKLREP
jgi:hypothetical protein